MIAGFSGLSRKELEIVSWIEFYGKYFFRIPEIGHFFRSKSQQYNIVKNLLKKKRIIKLGKDKYYLTPIKAKSGSWVENPFIIADEIFCGNDYFVGGYAAAYFWRLSEHIPAQIDIYTTKRQGKKEIFNTRFVFHRTTEKSLGKAVTQMIEKHSFKVLGKNEAKEWMKSRG
jgi:predicted transcriptional regulator of viral defense system